VKKRKNYSRAKQLSFKPEINLCPYCKKQLKQSHIAWQKNIFTLKQTLHVTSYAYKCKNKTCQNTQTYRSTEAELLSLKYYQYGIDIITKIGHLYYTSHQTIDQIKQTLTNQPLPLLQISRSEINLLCQVYLALTKADKQQNPHYLNKIKQNGHIILALDGVQPEKGNQTLWILKDQLTSTVLLAKNLDSADKNSIATLLKEIKTLGIPVKAIISDGQRSIRLAVKQEFPNVPHQLCHFHFLRNIARPISELDRALKVDLKKKIRAIKHVEQKTLDSTDKQSRLVYQYCQTIRFALQDDGCYPLAPGGLRLYNRLKTIQQSLNNINRTSPNTELSKLLKKLAVLDELEPRYQRIKQLYSLVFKVNRILKQKKAGSTRVELDMFLFFERLCRLYRRSAKDRDVLVIILKFMVSYWEGLFHHYDEPSLVYRTNNDLERFIRGLKVSHRKVTGRASCHSFVVRYGAFVVLLDDGLSCDEVLLRFRSVGYSVFRQCFSEVRGFRCRVGFKRRLIKNFKSCISTLEAEWAKAVV
jgi:hypothetical protein